MEKVPIWRGRAACDGGVSQEPMGAARRRNMHVDMREEMRAHDFGDGGV